MTNQKCATVSLTLSTRSCREGAMEKSAPNHGGTFSLKNECSFRLSGHASPAQRKPDSNSSCRSPVPALQKLGRNCSIYPRFISMLQEDFRLANKFPEVSTLAGPSLVPRLSPQKRGGGESLVTSAGKVVDFRRVIIHVINVGRSHFSNNCHVI